MSLLWKITLRTGVQRITIPSLWPCPTINHWDCKNPLKPWSVHHFTTSLRGNGCFFVAPKPWKKIRKFQASSKPLPRGLECQGPRWRQWLYPLAQVPVASWFAGIIKILIYVNQDVMKPYEKPYIRTNIEPYVITYHSTICFSPCQTIYKPCVTYKPYWRNPFKMYNIYKPCEIWQYV